MNVEVLRESTTTEMCCYSVCKKVDNSNIQVNKECVSEEES